MSKTIFLAGGSGFIGTEVCRTCVAAGDKVLALCRSQKSAQKVAALGAIPVEGDLLEAGNWQNQARAAEYVIHLAQPQFFGGRITTRRAKRYKHDRAVMDVHLLGALDPHAVKRVIYVSGACYYGDLGVQLSDETAAPHPHGIGRYIVEAVEQLGIYLKEGLPVVTAFPGCVYGPSSWFEEYLFARLARGRSLIVVGHHSSFISTIHVRDCARAIVHLLEHGGVGERYFLVDDKPAQWIMLQTLAANATGVPLRFISVPRWLMTVGAGRILAESMEMSFVLSNAKLKTLGFKLEHPTIETGIPAVIAQLQSRATHA